MSHTVSLLEKDVPKNVSHFSLDGYPCFIQINYQILENRDVVSHVHFSSCLSFQITVNIWRINSFFKLNVSAVSPTTALNRRDITKDNAKKTRNSFNHSFLLNAVCGQQQTIHYTLYNPACSWLPSIGIPSKICLQVYRWTQLFHRACEFQFPLEDFSLANKETQAMHERRKDIKSNSWKWKIIECIKM